MKKPTGDDYPPLKKGEGRTVVAVVVIFLAVWFLAIVWVIAWLSVS